MITTEACIFVPAIKRIMSHCYFNIKKKIKKHSGKGTRVEDFEKPSFWIKFSVYISLIVLTVFGHLRDLLRKLGIERKKTTEEKGREGFVPLYQGFEGFCTRNMYRRMCDICSNPICSVPGPLLKLKERITHDYNWTFEITGRDFYAVNMGSYNYLGFAENSGACTDTVEKTIHEYGTSICSTRHELGTLQIHKRLEKLVAEFLGCEDSIVVGMGFATNSTNIPMLVNKGCLILSDKCNHTSIVLGCRLSGAVIRVYKHNDMKNLEEKLIAAITEGQPSTHKPWRKIMIFVEGVYSVEGTIVNLPALIELKKKYKCYLYVDEAHSVGAIGPNGRGVCDYFGCNSKDIDILMGTFTKSFGSAGGYIAGSKKIINHLRRYSQSFCYGTSMSAAVASQIITSMEIIMGRDNTKEGARRIKQLQLNTHYFRRKLKEKGFIVYGNNDSPVVPVMLFVPATMPEFFRQLLRRGVATVVVGYPATSLSTGRARFCISSAHTKEMLDQVLSVVEEVGKLIMIDYANIDCKK